MDVGGGTLPDQGFDHRKIASALLDDERREKMACGRWKGNAALPRRYGHLRADIPFHRIQFFYQGLRTADKNRTRFRQSNTPAVPLQELDTEPVLQALHAFAQRRLGDAELDGRL